MGCRRKSWSKGTERGAANALISHALNKLGEKKNLRLVKAHACLLKAKIYRNATASWIYSCRAKAS